MSTRLKENNVTKSREIMQIHHKWKEFIGLSQRYAIVNRLSRRTYKKGISGLKLISSVCTLQNGVFGSKTITFLKISMENRRYNFWITLGLE